MGREVRKVPKDWEHPKNARGYIPLFEGRDFASRESYWLDEKQKWDSGETHREAEEQGRPITCTFIDWAGERPHRADYMPEWPEDEATHYQMYEDVSEGTPISPVMESPEKLARWLADNGASTFGSFTATYEQWLVICRGRGAPSVAMTVGDGQVQMQSGVEAVADTVNADGEEE